MPVLKNTIRDLGFVLNRRAPIAENRSEPVVALPTENLPLTQMYQELPPNGIDFDKLTINKLYVNQNLESSNFESGSTGWQIQGDGNVEFNNGSFRGDLIAGSIHIPDQDTTANSFHVDSDGNMWIGCTETNFTADNENAQVYFLKTGAGFIKSALSVGSTASTYILIDGVNRLIKSSNFSTGSTGWQIENDGSAEFQDVVIAGATSTFDSQLVTTVRDQSGSFFEQVTFVGSKNDGLTENAGGGTLDRDLLLTQLATSGGTNTYLQSDYLGSLGGNYGNEISWNDDLEFFINVDAVGAGIEYFGFIDGTIASPYNNNITRHILFIIDSGNLYASVADGTTQSVSSAISGVTVGDWNSFKFVFDAGTNVKFYVKTGTDNDWVLKETLTSNLPTGTLQDPRITIGVRNNGSNGEMAVRNNYVAKAIL